MKKLLIAALAAACVCASTAVSFAGSAPPAPAATAAAAPAPSSAPVDTATPGPRLDLRSPNNPVKRRQIEDVKLLPKRKSAAAKLCADHGFGALYGFTRDDADGGWLVVCKPKTGTLPSQIRQLPMLMVDSLP